MVVHDFERPEVDWTKYPGHESFSPHVVSHIEARDLENRQGHRHVNVLNLQTGESAGTILLNDFVFGTNPRIDIMAQNVRWYHKAMMPGNTYAPDRSDVRGGSKKPWPQKGTGRARHGSTNSPLWHKGGIAHGPQVRLDMPKSVPGLKPHAFNLPYRVRRLGVRAALSCRLAQDDLVVVEDLDNLPGDKQEFAEMCNKYELKNALFCDGFENDHLTYLTESVMEWKKSDEAKNIMDFEYLLWKTKLAATDIMHLLVYHILARHKLVLSLDAVRMLEERLCEDGRIITHPHYRLLQEGWMLPRNMLNKEYDPYKKMIRGKLIPFYPRRPMKHLMSLTRRDTPYGQK